MRFGRVSWLPVDGIGELANEFYGQWREYAKGWKARRRAMRETRAVGPGGAPERIGKQLSDED